MHPSPDRLLDEALPRRHVRERHARVEPAPPDGVRRAMHEVRMGELPLTRGLMRVRIGMDFRLSPAGTRTRLETETRVLASGPRAKRAFVAYWVDIRAGSGLIRRELLREVARRAASASG